MDFEYHILSPKQIYDHAASPLTNQAFSLWIKTWSQLFKGRADVYADDFLKADYLSLVKDPRSHNVAAIILSTYYDLDSLVSQHTHYFVNIDESAREYFRKNKQRHMLSLEYLTVDPQYRHSFPGFSCGHAIVALAVKLMEYMQLDCSVGTARTDNSAIRIAKSLGACVIRSEVVRYGYPTALFSIDRKAISLDANSSTYNAVTQLWERRIDHTGTIKDIRHRIVA